GDMPSFDDCLELAVNGAGPGGKCLRNSNAAQKHIIIISDGDPSPPQPKLMQQIINLKISVSTVSVYPQQGMVPPTMQEIDKNIDPLFAHWQAGLGKSAAFTSDASPVWDEQWLSPQYSGSYGKFWSQMVRGVSRPAMSTDFSTTTERIGDKARLSVEVTNKEA